MKHTFATLTALLLASAPAAMAEDTAPDWLFVQTASSLASDGTTLTLPYEREIFAFTDRPNRLHAYINAHEMVNLWEFGKDTFAEDPPNAVLTWLEDGQLREAEVELLSAEVSGMGRAISYQFTHNGAGAVPEAATYVSLFVDDMSGAVKEGVCEVTKDQEEEGLVDGIVEAGGGEPPVMGAAQAGVAWLTGKAVGCD